MGFVYCAILAIKRGDSPLTGAGLASVLPGSAWKNNNLLEKNRPSWASSIVTWTLPHRTRRVFSPAKWIWPGEGRWPFLPGCFFLIFYGTSQTLAPSLSLCTISRPRGGDLVLSRPLTFSRSTVPGSLNPNPRTGSGSLRVLACSVLPSAKSHTAFSW